LVQALVKQNELLTPRLWLVTRGTMPVGQPLPLSVAQAPLWGLGKSFALEHPKMWGGMIDLAPDALVDEATTLLTEIWDSQKEDHLAFRDGQRYVARLVRSSFPKSQEVSLRSDSTYLITGGLGGLGLRVAQWMVEHGVRHLVLIGRSGALIQAQEVLKKLEQTGAQILVAKADVSNEESMIRVLEEISASMPAVRGLVHAAGVLDDGTLVQQSWERFTRVMDPKLKGAWNLHKLTQGLPLEFFIMFSSSSSLLGLPGQSNYAAANAFMDALAHHRRALGLPGLSINWGQWAGTGMAANLSSYYQTRLTAQGMSPITSTQGLQVLGQLLGQASAQVGVLLNEWSMFKQQFSIRSQLPLLSVLVHSGGDKEATESASTQRNELLLQLESTQASERQQLLIAHIQAEVAKVLGLKPSQLPGSQQGFFDMGMDSLMALELKNRLEATFNSSLPSTLAFEYPTIADVAEYLAKEVLKWELLSTSEVELFKREDERAVDLSKIKQIPKDEVEASIAKSLVELENLLGGEL